MRLKNIIKTTRPSFLILSPICVFLGLSTAIYTSASINYTHFFLILIAAVSAHVSVNTLNEYFDFKSELDLHTNRTAFSGGSGALIENPQLLISVIYVGIMSLLITIVIGLYFIFIRGTEILPIGLLGVVIIASYTQWLNRSPLLCLVAPGLGFGILIVVGTHVLLSGEHNNLPWLISLIPFLLLNNLLLLNQYPDISADKTAGRKTFPIAFGMQLSHLTYLLSGLIAYALIPFYILQGYIPGMTILAFIPVLLLLYAAYGAFKYSEKIGEHPHYLAANVAASILTPLLLGIFLVVN